MKHKEKPKAQIGKQTKKPRATKKEDPIVITLTKGQVQGIKDAPEEFMREKKSKSYFRKSKSKNGHERRWPSRSYS